MSENVRKLIGVAAMAALVVVGLVTTSGGDDDVDFTRNFGGCRYESPYCRAELARLAPAFLEQAAPKANHLNRDPIFRYVPDGRNDGKVSIEAQKDAAWNFKDGKSGSDIKALSAGKASVLEGRGVDGKGGTASFRAGNGMNGKSGKAGIWLQSGGVEGVADRIAACVSSGDLIPDPAVTFGAAAVLKNVLVSSYTATSDGNVVAFIDKDDFVRNLAPQEAEGLQEACANGTFLQGSLTIDTVPFELSGLPLLLAECMESKVGGVFLKPHTEAMAADCVAIVLPALSPERAKRLGTYWQTQQQLVGTD